jgi:Protein kinase domain
VAVKRINANTDCAMNSKAYVALAELTRVTQSMRREIDALSSFHHINIVRLVGYCLPPPEASSACEVCLLYEFAPQGNVAALLKSNVEAMQLKWRSRLKIAIGVAKGLCCMHSSNPDCPACHGDLNSVNIVLMDDYTPKIIGLRLSNCVLNTSKPDMSTENKSGARQDTSDYSCPDFIRNKAMVSDVKCDIFSFGIILLELLTGQLQGWVNEEGEKVMLDIALNEKGALKADNRVQWPAIFVDDLLLLARECVAPHHGRIGSMTTVTHRLVAMSNMHDTPTTTEIDLIEENDLLLARLAALQLQLDTEAMQSAETTHTCTSCSNDCIPASKGAFCSNRSLPHFVCGEERSNCIGNMLCSQSIDVTNFVRNSFGIVCVSCAALSPSVVSTFDVSVLAQQSNKEALTAYISAITDAERQQRAIAADELRSHFAVEVMTFSESKSKADRKLR